MTEFAKVRPEVKTEELINNIKSKGIKLRYLADAIGVHESTLQRKLKNEQEFKLSEIVRISSALSLTDAERDYLFSLNG